RRVALIERQKANAVAAPVIGRDRVRVKGGDQKAAVVLQPRVVEPRRGGRSVAGGGRCQVIRVRRRVQGLVVPDREQEDGHVEVILLGPGAPFHFGEKQRVAAAVLDGGQISPRVPREYAAQGGVFHLGPVHVFQPPVGPQVGGVIGLSRNVAV